MITRQDDITILQVKDYIKQPKPNGYRSLHLIVEVPIFLSHSKELMRVEVQLRTIAMDLWSSIEHQLQYKRGTANAQTLRTELKECAESIAYLDLRMQAIMRHIEED
ncbi:GTP pyrophosphokinase YwaC [bioreactor metagenome]|uniref:GTP pyrophosphokinase YwaC n=1 Tax=bioreactor metagenome TaxID=1076179 RepID=A0A645F694_9ZZZZ